MMQAIFTKNLTVENSFHGWRNLIHGCHPLMALLSVDDIHVWRQRMMDMDGPLGLLWRLLQSTTKYFIWHLVHKCILYTLKNKVYDIFLPAPPVRIEKKKRKRNILFFVKNHVRHKLSTICSSNLNLEVKNNTTA